MTKGKFVWQVAHGETPDEVKNHPKLKGLKIPRTGRAGLLGVLVTKSLVICGEAGIATTPNGQPGAMLRAYDKKIGEEKGAVYMAAGQSGSPMTYMADGRQYVVSRLAAAIIPLSLSLTGCRRSKNQVMRTFTFVAALLVTGTAAAQTPVMPASKGVFTAAQAAKGAALFSQNCARCHGAGMSGQDVNPPLIGAAFLANWINKRSPTSPNA